MEDGAKESLITCRTSQGVELRGAAQRLTRHEVVFEIHRSGIVLQLSQVLQDFRVFIGERPVYGGKAVIRDVVNTGLTLVCQASLDEGWIDLDSLAVTEPARMKDEFGKFIRGWQKTYRIEPALKLVVADLQTFLGEMRTWLEQVELAIRASPSADRVKLENEVTVEVGREAMPALDELFDRFEGAMDTVEEPLLAAHRAYAKRQLHPLLLCAPFVYRAHEKPLGYAGDYEMVNMVVREACDGGSLFAKIVNLWFVEQLPAVAHRNRIKYLSDKLTEEAARATSRGREARIMSLGCGPAAEVQRFLESTHVSNRCRFTLLDFNEETLMHAKSALERAKNEHGRRTAIKLVRKSVTQLLKEAGKTVQSSAENQFDLVYCAGLFDYLSDAVCKRLANVLYDKLAPGGLLLVTNVDACNPRQHTMESILEWNLIYRDHRGAEALVPAAADPGRTSIRSDHSGVNLLVEIRKGESG